MTYGSVAIGALPVAFGLGWFSSFLAILVGTLIGSLFVALMALMGPKSGTNGTVTSSAFFGLRGRYIGSFITQIIDLGFFAMILWVSAPPLVQARARAPGLGNRHDSADGRVAADGCSGTGPRYLRPLRPWCGRRPSSPMPA